MTTISDIPSDHSYCILSYSSGYCEQHVELLGLSKDIDKACQIAREACQAQYSRTDTDSSCYSFVSSGPHRNNLGYALIKDRMHGKKIVDYRTYVLKAENLIFEVPDKDMNEIFTVGEFVRWCGKESDPGYEEICRQFDMTESLGTLKAWSNIPLITIVAAYMAKINFGTRNNNVELSFCGKGYAVVQVDWL